VNPSRILLLALVVLIATSTEATLIGSVGRRKPASFQDIVFVDSKAKGNGDGSSWKNAFTDLGVALEKRRGWELWVAAGTYKPGSNSDSVGSTFNLGIGVILHGGFAGNETYLFQAKPNVNLTILSGDIGKSGNDSDNVNSVVWAEGDNLIDGFFITGGYQRGDAAGGLSAPGDIEVSRCVFKGNKSRYGSGALMVSDAIADIHDCLFQGNTGSNGGGINAVRGAISISNSLFYQNESDRWAGGVLFQAVEEARISNSTFYMNSAPTGSALSMVAAEQNVISNTIISNSIFWKNGWNGSRDSNESEIWVPQITKNNSVILKMNNCIVKGGTATKSRGVRIQDTLLVQETFVKTKDKDPKLLIEKEKFGLEGKDKILFTSDDGLNIASNSPGIDAGVAIEGMEKDITGKPRSAGKATDIGAYDH